MKRQSFRRSTHRWDDVDIYVPVIFSRERDQRAIRRKVWIGLNPSPRGQPLGLATIATDAPQIAGKNKDDLVPAERRLS